MGWLSIFFSGRSLWVYALMAGGVTLGFGWLKYTALQEEVETLQETRLADARTLENALAQVRGSQERIAAWESLQAEIVKVMEELEQRQSKAQEERRELYKKLEVTRLQETARAKPKLVERRVNAGSDNALRMLECATGSRIADCEPRNTTTDKATSP